MYAMLVLRGPQGRLVIPTESHSLNKVFTYLLTYLSPSVVSSFFAVALIVCGAFVFRPDTEVINFFHAQSN